MKRCHWIHMKLKLVSLLELLPLCHNFSASLVLINTVVMADMTGPLVSQFLRQGSPLIEEAKQELASSLFPALLFNDPTSFVRSAIDELMFRIAVQTAFDNTFGGPIKMIKTSGTTEFGTSIKIFKGFRRPKSRIADMEVVRSIEFYKTSFAFLGGAIAVMLLAAILIVPLFHEFWLLGRPVSLSPLEIATAMGAPLLASVASSNDTAREIMKAAGKQRVRYGEISEPGTGETVRRRIQFGQRDVVDRPVRGAVYD